MQVIGAGLPRTGTLTQKLALELLGFAPCYHWVDVIANLDRVAQWERALDGEAPWAEIFGDCQATVDWPGGFFYAELVEAYPQAKVVLSVRDPERWEASFRETIWDMCFGDTLVRHLSAARAKIDPRWERYLRLIDRMFWIDRGTFAADGRSRAREPDRGDAPPRGRRQGARPGGPAAGLGRDRGLGAALRVPRGGGARPATPARQRP